MPELCPFTLFWGGSPTKTDYRKKGTRILTSLLEDSLYEAPQGLFLTLNLCERHMCSQNNVVDSWFEPHSSQYCTPLLPDLKSKRRTSGPLERPSEEPLQFSWSFYCSCVFLSCLLALYSHCFPFLPFSLFSPFLVSPSLLSLLSVLSILSMFDGNSTSNSELLKSG